ncbi:MAG: pentapeptide repeat-containing protein [Pseudomonadota bacterium]
MSDVEDMQARSLARENRLELIRREHRTLRVWKNFYQYRNHGDTDEASAAFEALIYWFLPGGRTLIILTISLGGFFTVLLMHEQNQLVAQQTYELRRQIYEQAQTDRAARVTDIKDKLYRWSDESRIARKAWEATPTEERSKRPPDAQPFFDAAIRSEALRQLLSLSASPLIPPTPAEYETLGTVLSAWPCRQFGVFCGYLQEKRPVDEANSDSSKKDRIEIDLAESFLSDTRALTISSTRYLRILAPHSDLSRANLSYAALRNADLSESTITRAVLDRTDLRKADLTRAALRKASLRGADLRGAFLRGADLRESAMDHARLENAVLGEKYDIIAGYIPASDLSGANLRFANLRGADLAGADLSGANLEYANLQGATLRGAILVGADLSDATLEDADLESANLESAIYDCATLLMIRPTDGFGTFGVRGECLNPTR